MHHVASSTSEPVSCLHFSSSLDLKQHDKLGTQQGPPARYKPTIKKAQPERNGTLHREQLGQLPGVFRSQALMKTGIRDLVEVGIGCMTRESVVKAHRARIPQEHGDWSGCRIRKTTWWCEANVL